MIERAYTQGERLGLAVWGQDEAGPFQTTPYPGQSWAPRGHPVRHPHEHFRNGTAKMLTLFHPSDGQVRVKGVTSTANAVLHPWLKAELQRDFSHAAGACRPPRVRGQPTGSGWSWQAN